MFQRDELVALFVSEKDSFLQSGLCTSRQIDVSPTDFWETIDLFIKNLRNDFQIRLLFFQQIANDVFVRFDECLQKMAGINLLLAVARGNHLCFCNGFL